MADQVVRPDDAPEGRQVRVTVSLDKELVDHVQAEAEIRHVSVSQLMRHAVRTLLTPTGVAIPQPNPRLGPPPIKTPERAGEDDVAPSAESDEQSEDRRSRLLRLPFGSEFTPRTVGSLGEALKLVRQHPGTLEELQEALRVRYFSTHSSENQKTLAYNCALSMRNYGLLGKDGRLTEFGRQLFVDLWTLF